LPRERALHPRRSQTQIGLESSLQQMRKAGAWAFIVALIIVRELRPLVQDADYQRASGIRKILDHYSGHHPHHLLEPLSYFFVPIFFVSTGMQVRLAGFFDASTLLIALGVRLPRWQASLWRAMPPARSTGR